MNIIMTKQAYIVTQVGYEYNDETYNRVSSAGDAVTVYTNKKKAEQASKELNIKLAREVDLFCYTSNWWYDKKKVKENNLLKSLLPDVDLEDCYNYNFSKVSDEDLLKVIDILDLEFSTVQEVELED